MTAITKSIRTRMNSEVVLLVLAIGLYFLYLIYLTVGLGFRLLRSDVLVYWNDSLAWTTPFSTWFVPGYPFAIAIMRGLTFNLLLPDTLMVLISSFCYLVAVKSVYMICLENGQGSSDSFKLTLLFALYPFVGLTYSVYPLADSMAIALLVLCCFSFQKERWVLFTMCAALGLLTHKITWFFIPILLIIAFVKFERSRLILPLVLLPLLLLEIAGTLYHGDLFWMLRWSTEKLMSSRSSLPVFDGLFGSLIYGSLADKIKGIAILIVTLWGIMVLVISSRYQFLFGIAIPFSILLMLVVVNQYEIWSVFRFSRILLIPSIGVLSLTKIKFGTMFGKWRFSFALLIGIISNMVYGYYMVRIYFA